MYMSDSVLQIKNWVQSFSNTQNMMKKTTTDMIEITGSEITEKEQPSPEYLWLHILLKMTKLTHKIN